MTAIDSVIDGVIDSVAALEAVVGKAPPATRLKVIDHIDATAQRWLSLSPLMFASAGHDGGMAITLGGGPRGFAVSNGPTLSLATDMLDAPDIFAVGHSFSSLFLLPGIGETLRINGRVAAVEAGTLTVAVEECYVHCAKALIRSDFWKVQPDERVPAGLDAMIANCRFIALATMDAAGHADLSPKGDPAGLMVQGDSDGALWFPDRPGNRLTDSFHNILSQPRVAAALVVPGSCHVVTLTGRATMTTDQARRQGFAVRDKVPALATRIDELQCQLHDSAALRRATLWPAAEAPEDVRPAKMFAEHLRLNKSKGIGARLASAVVSIPGLMQKGLDKDYKDNLY